MRENRNEINIFCRTYCIRKYLFCVSATESNDEMTYTFVPIILLCRYHLFHSSSWLETIIKFILVRKKMITMIRVYSSVFLCVISLLWVRKKKNEFNFMFFLEFSNNNFIHNSFFLILEWKRYNHWSCVLGHCLCTAKTTRSVYQHCKLYRLD